MTKGRTPLVVATFVAGGLLAFATDAFAQRRDRGDGSSAETDKRHDVRTIARLGKGVRGNAGFFDVSYAYRDEKGRKKSRKAFLQIGETKEVYRDRQVRIGYLEAGQKIFILGRVVEREVQDRGGGLGGAGRGGAGRGGGGRGGKDRQIQNARVVVTGEAVEVNRSFIDPKEKSVMGLEARGASSNAGLWVKYQGNDFRVTLGRKAPVLLRYRMAEKERKLVKKAKYIHLLADESDVRPDTARKSDLGKPSLEMKRLIVLDPRLVASTYPLLFSR